MKKKEIILKNVRVHNLKNVDVTLPTNQFIVFTGVSGSGKSSLAFDTIFVEGQRRYIESLSIFARRHLGDMTKPDADLISGISPTIAIEQKTTGRNPRSSVGTITGIYDYLRVLYARIGIPHCPISGEPITPQTTIQIIQAIQGIEEGSAVLILSPYARNKKKQFTDDFAELLRKGFVRARIDGEIHEISEDLSIDKNVSHDIDIVIDRIKIEPLNHSRIAEAVEQALDIGEGMIIVYNPETREEKLFSKFGLSMRSGKSYPPLEPHDFSFNHPLGMCSSCQGLGITSEFNLEMIIDPNKSIAEDCCCVASSYQTVRFGNIYDNLARLYKFSVHTPWKDLSEKAKDVFLSGIETKWTRMRFVHPIKKTSWHDYVQWRGVLFEATQKYNQATSEVYRKKMRPFLHEATCRSCQGARIKPYPAVTLLGGKKIAEITAMPLEDVLEFFQKITLSPQQEMIGKEVVKEIVQRLQFLQNVGLNYLSLDRIAPTLSGGESQRVRLASQIGSGLVGATYVLDEPSIGLHPRDNTKLIQTLKKLRDKGNTVIVVEHDEETIEESDYIVDVGPGAGEKGGKIISEGSLYNLLNAPESLTGAYLSKRIEIEVPKKRRSPSKEGLKIVDANHHNLKNLSVTIPLGVFVAVTGVSGSGKSSLVTDILYPSLSNILQGSSLPVGKHGDVEGMKYLDKVIAIDQTPIGRTPRSNPATYSKLFDDIRDLFASLPQSMAQNYKAGRFSFNVKEGSCPHCEGVGMTKIDMDFMEDIWVLCEFCKGKRFDANTLSITYKNKNIHDILEMTVSEALSFFEALPKIKEKIQTLEQVGLGYIRLGQASPTLSGGEAQRIKLAKELSRPSTGKTVYILDEPTTGLHFFDVHKLCKILQKLVDLGNTVIVIEHNMELVKTADWIIDLGPEGGSGGGKLVGEGTPESIAKQNTPTGHALSRALFAKGLVQEKKTPPHIASKIEYLTVEGACEHNLQHVHAKIPREKITVCTGPSGSGKTSFAFDTIYAEGQRRYIESLSAYARQFVKQMPKPKVDEIDGLSAAIAIEQKNQAGNPRSTIGTMTETYDFLRILYTHLGIAFCPETGEKITTISKEYVLEKLLEFPEGTRLHILSPLKISRKESFSDLLDRVKKLGFLRIRLNQTYYELDEEIPFDPKRKNELAIVIDRVVITKGIASRLLEAIDSATTFSGNTMLIDCNGKDSYYNLAFAVPSTGKSYPPITPHTFSFNTAHGMCMDCLGLGFQYGANFIGHPELRKYTPLAILKQLWKEYANDTAFELALKFLQEEGIDPKKPLHKLTSDELQLFFNGSKKKIPSSLGKKLSFSWLGINHVLAREIKIRRGEIREFLIPFMDTSVCISCKGTRLNPLARNVKIEDVSIADLCHFSIDKTFSFLSGAAKAKSCPKFLEETIDQLMQRLKFLREVGLGYLSLDRSAPTLSGGETQRIRLAKQLGSGLTGCLYVLDEPTIGLHPHNNALLHEALVKLRDLGNTLLLVEHDPMTIQIADYILDFGPQAGILGGKITARGTYSEILENHSSLSGDYLSGRKCIPIPAKRRSLKKWISLKKVSTNNLKNIEVKIPIKAFTCITGVSGSGKSTLLTDVLQPAASHALSSNEPGQIRFSGAEITGLENFDKLIVIDQNPIGHTIRADVSTYTDLLTPLRYLFASLPGAQVKGLQPKHFSFNHRKGMCTHCFGLGTRTIELQFLPAVKVTCESCKGYRLNPLSLQVSYKDKHLGKILELTVQEAKEFLSAIPKMVNILDKLISVGLGYVKLNQEIVTLSGGEAQRIRLSRELSKRATGNTLYLFDEPTVGLHSDDISKILPIFHSLVEKGNTIVMIEHHLETIANADYVIDLGPEAGEEGGYLVTEGTPEEVATHPTSYTGKYLKETLLTHKENR